MKQNIMITDYACNKCKNKYIDNSLLDEQNDLNLPIFISPYTVLFDERDMLRKYLFIIYV